jgi:hypothetical protein
MKIRCSGKCFMWRIRRKKVTDCATLQEDKHVGWINNILATFEAIYVHIEADKYDTPNWLGLLDYRTTDTVNEKYLLRISRSDFDCPKTSDYRHSSDELYLRKLPEAMFKRRLGLYYSTKVHFFASAANCTVQKRQVDWERKALKTGNTFKKLRPHDICIKWVRLKFK